MKAYFSFFPILAIVLISLLLLNIYSIQEGLAQESENAQLLLDRIYFSRADAEESFGGAALEGPEALANWEKAIELQDSLEVEAFFGQEHSPEDLFYSGNMKPPISFDLDSRIGEYYRSRDLLRRFEGQSAREMYPLLEGEVLLMVDDPYETLINPSFSASFSSKTPRTSSLLSIKRGDFEVFKASG